MNEKPVQGNKAGLDGMKDIIDKMQESLDSLRLFIKYLLFDLEATKRENTYLRKLLDKKGR